MTTTCPHCESKDIQYNIKINLSAEIGYAGLAYRAMVFSSTEPLLSDLCKNCGTVIRLHVKNTDRKWNTG